MLRLKPAVPAADIGRMSGLEIVGTGTTTDRVGVEVAFEWVTELPQTHLVVNGTRLRLNEEETLELASWLLQCVGNASSQRAQSEAILRRIEEASGSRAHVASPGSGRTTTTRSARRCRRTPPRSPRPGRPSA